MKNFGRRLHPESHVRPLGIVVIEVFGNLFPPDNDVPGYACNTLLLDRPIESFKMSVVVRRPDPGVPMAHPSFQDPFREPSGKLRAMV